jgi:beta-lactamase superfamily II metal-dependent hydrolase
MPIIDNHVVRVTLDPTTKGSPPEVITLFWGDEVSELKTKGGRSRVVLDSGRAGWVSGRVRTRPTRLLRATFVDVGQGDACLLESPSEKTILVDGGESQRLARYLARSCVDPGSPDELVVFDAVVVTHGDADHFEGLSILATDAAHETRHGKRIRFATDRVFHNGLVKRPANIEGRRLRPIEMFGRSARIKGRPCVVDLVDDITSVPRSHMNRPFRAWADGIREMRKRRPLMSRRIEYGDDSEFAFFDPAVRVEVLGPTTLRGKGKIRGLPFLSAPGESGTSPSHTINGHSIVLRLTYGHIRLLLAADLNSAAEGELLKAATSGSIDLTAEVLKVPHHGSGDFASTFFREVRPLVSVVSTGDEDELHEYIHPRANLMGALGKAGRTEQPIVIVTDLAAFDRYAGPALRAHRLRDGRHVPVPGAQPFYARERIAHGVVHVRTDGQRLFVGTWSGRPGRTEHYLFDVDRSGAARVADVDLL